MCERVLWSWWGVSADKRKDRQTGRPLLFFCTSGLFLVVFKDSHYVLDMMAI